jgi:hypothetical protein
MQTRGSYHHGSLPATLADAAARLAREGGPEAVVLREAATERTLDVIIDGVCQAE